MGSFTFQFPPRKRDPKNQILGEMRAKLCEVHPIKPEEERYRVSVDPGEVSGFWDLPGRLVRSLANASPDSMPEHRVKAEFSVFLVSVHGRKELVLRAKDLCQLPTYPDAKDRPCPLGNFGIPLLRLICKRPPGMNLFLLPFPIEFGGTYVWRLADIQKWVGYFGTQAGQRMSLKTLKAIRKEIATEEAQRKKAPTFPVQSNP